MKRGVDYIGVGAGAIIFNNEGKVFIAQRGPGARNESGKWDFPLSISSRSNYDKFVEKYGKEKVF
ncbi:MAG: hypothetical protein Q7R99_03655 [bacterium]|nr:hypothetical protein [bacterium]